MPRSNGQQSCSGRSRRTNPEEKMVQCTLTALEKMRDMFQAALLSPEEGTCERRVNHPNVRCGLDEKCEIKCCPFRGETEFTPGTLRKLCANNNASLDAADPRKDRDAMRLRPGEVGLRGDRATFHLGGGPSANAKAAKDGRSSAAIYYNVQPEAVADSAIAQDGYMQRRYVKQMLPPLPATTEPLVGPVTGLPVDRYKEDIYVLRLGKQHDEPDDMAPLQIEMRVPKDQDEKPKDMGTQFAEQDYLPSATVVPIEPKPAKSKKKDKKAGDAKKGKKATKKK